MTISGILMEGFMLGVATGPYCLTSCAPVLVPALLSDGDGGRMGRARFLAEFIGGRFVAYLVFGMLGGLAGEKWAGGLPLWLMPAATLFCGLLMIYYFVQKSAPHFALCEWTTRTGWAGRIPFTMGFIVGLNLCPPFVTGLARVLGLGSWGWGGVYFAAFFAGTTLYLLPLAAAVPFPFSKRLQTIGSLTAGLVGLWFIGTGLVGLMRL